MMINRRNFIKKSAILSTSTAAAISMEEKILLANNDTKEQKSKNRKPAPVKGLKKGKIKDVVLSRIILGGNLIGGWAHSRDLMYVSKLLKAYNTEEKIIETLQLAEENGINTILINPRYLDTINNYNQKHGGKIQIICECHPKPDQDITETVMRPIDAGAVMVYIRGVEGDKLVYNQRLDLIEKTIDLIKRQNVPAGIGSHSLDVPIACEKAGIENDFYVKTLHHDQYWSANPKEHRKDPGKPGSGRNMEHDQNHDNIWCINPEETVNFMKSVKKPWIAFKVLAAGAISPTSGFKYAFQNGADFCCVGMFDFQVRENVKIAKSVLARIKSRERTWMG
jgi:hypothetical protein